VWFSGGRALGEIVEPLASGVAPGGAVPREFTGEVRSVSRRVFRADELPPVTDNSPLDRRGGVLRLRVVLPDTLATEGEPLFAAGALYGSDIVFVREATGGAVTFHFEHFAKTHLVSEPIRVARNREQVVELVLPSCPAGEAFGRATSGELIVRVNGVDVVRGRSECAEFAPGDERVGRNPFGTTCAPEFRGWLTEITWLGR